MKSLNEKYGPWALVTGASSGIGNEFCRQLAGLGFHIVAVARREAQLNNLKGELEQLYAVSVKTIVVDLTDRNVIQSLNQVTESLEIGLLINCAGFALTGNLFDHSVEDQLLLIDLNCRAPLELSYHFGEKMRRNGKGGIVNIASASAFLPMPFWSNYAASKSYLVHLSEGLWFELRGQGVDVIAVCPGATRTEFASIAGVKNGGMEPAKVVRKALVALSKKQPVVVVGGLNRLIVALTRFFPRKTVISMGAKAVQNSRNS